MGLLEDDTDNETLNEYRGLSKAARFSDALGSADEPPNGIALALLMLVREIKILRDQLEDAR